MNIWGLPKETDFDKFMKREGEMLTLFDQLKPTLSKIKNWMQREVVLTVAWGLAIVSVFFVPLDRKYLEYVDFSTLGLLFCLMSVMAGLRRMGIFYNFAAGLLRRVKDCRKLAGILIFLCFFSSMLITNDVALITFVPLALEILHMAKKDDMVIPVVVMQTIAANLGSMLTPVGNPQNLYLYARSQMSAGAFVLLMLPYVCAAGVGFLIFLLSVKKEKLQVPDTFPERVASKRKVMLYACLFILCLFTVARVLPFWIPLAVVCIVLFLGDRPVFMAVDYSLLLTFVGFFVFIGNMGRIPAFERLIASVLEGREVLAAAGVSQLISNVPAALLLSGFSQKWELLIIGVNIGGLGTLIASMASLISYKQIAVSHPQMKGAYFRYFTIANLIFLAGLLGVYMLMSW